MILPHRRQSAFTLVEVMLALAIFSMVIAAIYGTWRAIIGATQAGQIAAADVQRQRVALRCIEQSLTYTEMFAANYSYYGFVAENGSSATLSFVSRLPKDFPRSGRFGDMQVRRVMFSLEPGEERGRDLVMRQSWVLAEDFDIDELEHPLRLMHNVKQMEMEFWDMQKEDWVDEWDQTNQVPRLIRVAISTENPRSSFDRGEEHELLIAPICNAVESAWQGRAPGQQGGRQPGLQPPPAPTQ